MKRILPWLITVLVAVTCIGLSACKRPQHPPRPSVTYEITFESNGGDGEAPVLAAQEEGAVFRLPQSTFTLVGHAFGGWSYGGTTYREGAEFTMPACNVTLTAVWVKADPAFSKSEYDYDRLGGGDLELPLKLFGAEIGYVELNGTSLTQSQYRYDESVQCLVLHKDVLLMLSDGVHTVQVITTAVPEGAIVCSIAVDNSVKTSFDESRSKSFRYGYEDGVTFSVDLGMASVRELRIGDTVVGAEHYEVGEETLTVKSSILKYYAGKADFTLDLTNNDRYDFSVATNILFATDYDIVTIHDTFASNIGHNPLYQYSDNVAIADSPATMNSGKALCFTPNTEDVVADCHGIYTLRAPEWASSWYMVDFESDLSYAVSFDYMTEDTTVGDFSYRSAFSGWRKELLLGAENDDTVHHFSAVLSGDEIGGGLFLWAFFKNGGGRVWVDNFRLTEIDAIPTVGDAQIAAGERAELAFDPQGMAYTVTSGGNTLEASYDAKRGVLVIEADAVARLGEGKHEIAVDFGAFVLETELRVISGVAELADTEASYVRSATGEIRLYGTFDNGISLTSLRQSPKSYDGGFLGGWEFIHTDFTQNLADRVSLTTGTDGTGYLTLPEAFLDCFEGTTHFVAEFSNGAVEEFTVHSNARVLANYDESLLYGELNGVKTLGGPINSGLWGNSIAEAEPFGADGNHALVVRSTEGAAERNAFTVRFHQHVWEWYNVPDTKAGELYRIRFDYTISSGLTEPTYFMILAPQVEDLQASFFGSGYEAVPVTDYYQLRWLLTADGQTHTFDSGWFTYNGTLRMSRIVFPLFTAADQQFVALDNYCIEAVSDPLAGLTYEKGSQGLEIDLGRASFVGATLDGAVLDGQVKDGILTLDAATLDAVAAGSHLLTLTTGQGLFRGTLSVTAVGTALLTQTEQSFAYGAESVTLAGTFDRVSVMSATKSGTHEYDATRTTPAAVDPACFEVRADGLTVKKELLDVLYGTTTFVLTFSNGTDLTFTLTSDVYFFTNFDETYVFQPFPGHGNGYHSQDDTTMTLVDGTDGKAIRYDVTKGTGLAATTEHNKILMFETSWHVAPFYKVMFETAYDYVLTFDYTVVNEGQEKATYNFYEGPSTALRAHPLEEGTHSFTFEFSGGDPDLYYIAIGCANIGGVKGSYLLIDNYRIVQTEKSA